MRLDLKNIDIKNRGKQHAGAILRQEKTPSSVLFSRGKMSNEFFTEDSKLYITPREQKMLRSGVKLDRNVKKWDSLSSLIVENFVRLQPSRTSKLLELPLTTGHIPQAYGLKGVWVGKATRCLRN